MTLIDNTKLLNTLAQQKITIKNLVEQTGLSRPTISRLVNGHLLKTHPLIIARIACILGLSYTDLILPESDQDMGVRHEGSAR